MVYGLIQNRDEIRTEKFKLQYLLKFYAYNLTAHLQSSCGVHEIEKNTLKPILTKPIFPIEPHNPFTGFL